MDSSAYSYNFDKSGASAPFGYSDAAKMQDELTAEREARAASAASAERSMAFEAEQAQLNREFQAQQSATAYQRAVADMKAAGINPILAYQQGGASTSAGSTASGSAFTASAPSNSMATAKDDFKTMLTAVVTAFAAYKALGSVSASKTMANARMMSYRWA